MKQIVMSKYHSVFLTQEGQIYTCGHGQGGRLGHGDERTCVVRRFEHFSFFFPTILYTARVCVFCIVVLTKSHSVNYVIFAREDFIHSLICTARQNLLLLVNHCT